MSNIASVKKYFLDKCAQVGKVYRQLVRQPLLSSKSGELWQTFQETMQESMEYVDLITAAKMRWNAIHQKTNVPKGAVTDLDTLKEANPWMQEHARRSTPAIVWRAQTVAKLEKDHAEKMALAQQPISKERPYRLERQFRDALSDTANVSEQITLENEVIRESFPFIEFYTREDKRVRPTHAAMNGFVAVNSWEGWAKIRTPCGYNCRCGLVFRTMSYAKIKGWADKDGRAKFTVRWPNSASERNYNAGEFPDKAFQTPRYVVLGSYGSTPQTRPS